MVIYKASLKLQGFWQRVKESKSYLTNFSCIHEKTKPRCIKEDFATASVKLPRGHKGTHVRGTQRCLCSSKQNLHQYYHHIGYKYGVLHLHSGFTTVVKPVNPRSRQASNKFLLFYSKSRNKLHQVTLLGDLNNIFSRPRPGPRHVIVQVLDRML